MAVLASSLIFEDNDPGLSLSVFLSFVATVYMCVCVGGRGQVYFIDTQICMVI